MIEIWVPIRDDGIEGLRPDIPMDINRLSDEGDVRDMTDSNRPLAFQYMNVIVDEGDLTKIDEYLTAEYQTTHEDYVPSEKELLWLKMVRKLRMDAYYVQDGWPVPSEAWDDHWPNKQITGGSVYYRPPLAANIRLIEPDDITDETVERLCERLDLRADRFFDNIEDIEQAAAPYKRMIRGLLIQAEKRGLSPAKAEAIRLRHSLPESATIEQL